MGTSKLAHFEQNLAAMAKGPLPDDQQALMRAAFLRHDRAWTGLI